MALSFQCGLAPVLICLTGATDLPFERSACASRSDNRRSCARARKVDVYREAVKIARRIELVLPDQLIPQNFQYKREGLRLLLIQQEVARRLRRPQSYVAKYENGERRLDVVEFVLIARTIGADPLRLLKDVLRRDI